MQYKIQLIKKEDNQYIKMVSYSLGEKVFSYWIRVHKKNGYVIRKIDSHKIVLQKNNISFVCTKSKQSVA